MRAAVQNRTGLTLMEVVVSLFIFLLSLAAIGQLFYLGSQLVLEARFKQEGAFLCQAKLAEFSSGVAPFDSQSDLVYEFDPEKKWTWSCSCELVQDVEPYLWNVTVVFQREVAFGTPLSVTMSQLIIDPANRGSTFDPAPITAAEEAEGEDGTADEQAPEGGN